MPVTKCQAPHGSRPALRTNLAIRKCAPKKKLKPIQPQGLRVRSMTDAKCSTSYLVFSASLRTSSLNSRLADLTARVVAEQGGQVDVAALADFECPAYDGDVEQEVGPPLGAHTLCRRLVAADAFIIASPESNASLPG